MNRLLPIILLLLASPLCATTWYAGTSSANINAVTWYPTSTGSCAGSGTALVWGAQANGDVFDANGCTAIAVNVDPGTATGASAGVCGTVTVTVTLQTNSTNGGAFTYATANNIVIHANVTATTTTALAVSGSTGGGTICGNVNGGTASSAYGVNDSHISTIFYFVGNLTGGSGSSAVAIYGAGAGYWNIAGNAAVGTGSASYGMDNYAGNNVTMVGNCIGSNTVAYAGCQNGGTLTLTGNIINGKIGLGVQNTYANAFYYTPAAANYILSAKDSSYTLGTINGHATLLPTDPGASNVKTGVVYGPNTGTYSAGATVSANGGW